MTSDINCIKLINKHCRNFFWGISHDEKKMIFKSWDSICKPWIEGGFNIKEALSWNKALISKQIWELMTNNDSLWSQWTRAYILKGKNIWNIENK